VATLRNGRRPGASAREGSAPPRPTAIRGSLSDAPSLKSLDPAAARWVGALIRVSASHPAMTRVLDVLERLQDRPYRTNAVIVGEPGTGKGGLARALAQIVAPSGPVVRLDVDGFPEEAALEALCGRGRRAGAAEHADGGVLVVEELATLAPRVQEALLRLLKSGRVRRLGEEKDVARRNQVNVIALSDHDVTAAVAAGRLRHDLYHRLARLVLWLPPLRERPEDIGPSAIWMGNRLLATAGVPLELRTTGDLATASPQERRRAIELDESAIAALRAYAWPGNLRELEAALERALLLYREGARLSADEIAAALSPAGPMRS
jgi:DNA-binding NtrC family response regulator